MKVQVNWLKKYLEIDVPAEELGHVLTMAGLEIEGYERLDDEKGDVLELNVTPNRGYCLSHLGVARELSALMGGTFNPPDSLGLLEKNWGKAAHYKALMKKWAWLLQKELQHVKVHIKLHKILTSKHRLLMRYIKAYMRVKTHVKPFKT